MKKIIMRSLLGISIILSLFVIFIPKTAHASRVKDVPVTLTQPDNTTIQAYMSGDEFFNYYHDKDGNIIVQDADTGFYTYATIEDGEIKASSNIAQEEGYTGKSITYNDLDLEDNSQFFLRDQSEFKEELTKNALRIQESSFTTGVLNNIAIFIRFSDEDEYLTPEKTASLTGMFNASGRSMKSYLTALSENALTVNTSFYPKNAGGTVYSYQDSHPRGYYMPYNAVTNPIGSEDPGVTWTRGMDLLRNAVNAIKEQVPASLNIDKDNNGNVDNVCFVMSGQAGAWASFLWPHMSTYLGGCSINSKLVTAYNLQLEYYLAFEEESVLCHEMLHTLGFPDLYRYSYKGDTVGSWDIMDINTTPAQYSNTYSKNFNGEWTHPGEIGVISQNGHYTLYPVTSTVGTVAYKILLPFTDKQYIILEYRNKTTGTYDSMIPGSGLIIYRVDEGMQSNGNRSGPPDEVYVFRPGETAAGKGDGNLTNAYLSAESGRTSYGSQDLSGYGYVPGSIYYQNGTNTGIEIKNVSSAGATISFDVEINTSPIGGTYIGSGTESDPYIIRNAQELDMIRGYKRTGWDMSKHYKLGSDIDLSGYGIWEPIGNWNDPFNGSLDGAGYSISGMETTLNSVSEFIGLFSYIGYEGKVTNLNIIDCKVYGDPSKAMMVWAGGIAGGNRGVISNCYVKGKIYNANYAGGIAGDNGAQNGETLPLGTIRYDQSGAEPGTVKRYQSEVLDEKALYAMQLPATASRNYYGEIRNCYADVEVTGIRIGGGVGYAGGLVGFNEMYGLIQNSAATIQGTAVDAAGGISGANDGIISDTCAGGSLTTIRDGGSILGLLWFGDISNSVGYCDINDETACGGIIGRSERPSFISNNLYYDRQLCGKNPNEIGNALTTVLLTNGVLPSGLSSTYWEAKAGYYPRLKLLNNYLSPSEIPVYWGDNVSLRAVQQSFTLPDRDWNGHTVSWQSSDPDVINITGNTAQKAGDGTAVITAAVNDGVSTVSKEFQVVVAKPVSSITLDKTLIYIEPQGADKLTAVVLPADTPYQKVGWSSNRSWTIFVDADGNLKNIDANDWPTIVRAAAMDGSGVHADCIVKIPNTNAYLSYLTVLGFNNSYNYLTDFSFNNYNYNINVPYEVSKVKVDCAPQNMYATVENGNGFYSLTVGQNVIKVIVKADKEVSLTYTINITREKGPIGTPVIKSIASSGYDSITLSWTAVEGADGYEIWRSTSSTGTYTNITSQTGITYLNTNLITGKTYYYKVRAYYKAGNTTTYGGYSAYAAARPVPQAPASATAKALTYNSIKVEWSEITGASGYMVYRSTSENGIYSRIGTTARAYYTDNYVGTGTPYYYKVRAYRSSTSIYGNYSPVATAVTSLKPMENVTAATYYPTGIKISWNAVPGRTKYEIWRCDTEAGTYSKIGTTTYTYYNSTGLTLGNTYFYKVRAYRTVSNKPVYNEYSAPVHDTTYVFQVKDAKAAMYSVTSNKITWSSVPGASRYEVSRCDAKGNVILELPTTEYTYLYDKTVTPGETYYYNVRAYRNANTETGTERKYGAYSDIAACMSKVAGIKGVMYTVNSNKISWNSVSGRYKYEIWRSDSAETEPVYWTETTNTYVYDKNIDITKTYYYKVRAYVLGAGGEKVYCGFSDTVSVANKVTGTNAVSYSCTSVKVTWSAVASRTAYELYRCDVEGNVDLNQTPLEVTGSTYYIHTGLTTDTMYYYRVRAYQTIGVEKVYTNFSDVIPVKPVLKAVTGAKAAKYNSTKVKLTWYAVSGTTGYEIERCTTGIEGDFVNIMTTSTTGVYYYDGSLTTGTKYYYRIRAYRKVGENTYYGGWSSVVSATP